MSAHRPSVILAIVNGQNRQQASSPRRFAHLGGVMNRAAADPNSLERTRLYAAIKAIQPNSERRMQAIQFHATNFVTEENQLLCTHASFGVTILTEGYPWITYE
ncbi:hypothetical protein X801_05910 [Opisthorchis viverrini]|uniref:Uncharacterized protein n=1 Tax=Opisthorchis viverrini TaxID=6198 RepID=A0A1S8WUL7_OPIVI|nr:hypothetical protein X801_05910 [Opisthorchis viverrini]